MKPTQNNEKKDQKLDLKDTVGVMHAAYKDFLKE